MCITGYGPSLYASALVADGPGRGGFVYSILSVRFSRHGELKYRPYWGITGARVPSFEALVDVCGH